MLAIPGNEEKIEGIDEKIIGVWVFKNNNEDSIKKCLKQLEKEKKEKFSETILSNVNVKIKLIENFVLIFTNVYFITI